LEECGIALNSDALIDDLIGRGAASRAKLEDVRRSGAAGEALTHALAEAGCPPREIVAAMCAVTGLPEAPRSALAAPRVPASITLDPGTWLELPAVPFGEGSDGSVLIAAPDPDIEMALMAFDVPEFRLHLAPAALVQVALKRAYPELAVGDEETSIAPPTARSRVSAVKLDVDDAPPSGDELPTVALPAIEDVPDTEFGVAGDLREDPVLADLSGPSEAQVDAVDDEMLDEVSDDDDDFDGPTQAVDPAAFLPQLASGLRASALDDLDDGAPTRSVSSLSEADLDVDGFEGEFEPKTVAMSADEMRESLVAAGAPPPGVDDAGEPATVTISAAEMRENVDALRRQAGKRKERTDAHVAFSDVGPTQLREAAPATPSIEIEDDLGFTDERTRNPALSESTAGVDDDLGSNFDYSAAADEFDGEGSDVVITEPTERGKTEAASGPAASELPTAAMPSLRSEDDPFDEATIQAPPVEASPPAARPRAERRPPPSFEDVPATSSTEQSSMSLSDPDGGDDFSLVDDVDLVDEIESLEQAASFDESTVQGGGEPKEPVRVQAGKRSDKSARKLKPIDDDDDDLLFIDEESAVQQVDPIANTQVPEGPATRDLRGERTEAVEAYKPKPKPKPKPKADDKKAVDTSPTGPIAISGYEVRDVLGAGGMATVYRALQKSAEREVALKILSPHLANDTAFVARFQREIRSSVALTHANIVRTYDYGDEAGVYYMATEIMDGGSLREVLQETGRVPIPLTVRFIQHLLSGIGHAHRRGMVHRDIKPANLMLSSEGLLKIGDFGIAKSETDENLTRTGALFGTPAYMSPEQALGKQVDSRSDLFACGIILYELLAGDNPYQAESASAALLKVSRADPPPLLFSNPAIPQLLLDIVDKLQKRDADERYQTAEEALEDLAPLVEAVERAHNDVIKRFLEDRDGALRALDGEHAQLELTRARRLFTAEPPKPHAAATAAYIATKLDPDNESARRFVQQLREDHDIHFGQTMDTRIHDAERSLQDDPHAPGLLRRAADLHRADGNPFKAAAWLYEYLKVKPTDSHARNQLEHLTGGEQLGGYTPAPDTGWEPSSDLNWNKIGGADDYASPPDIPSDTQVPLGSNTAAAPEPSVDATSAEDIGLSLTPVGPDEMPSGGDSLFHSADDAIEVRPASSSPAQGDILRKATARARGGLQVIEQSQHAGGPPGAQSGPNILQQGRAEGPTASEPPKLELPQWDAAPGGPAPASASLRNSPAPPRGLTGGNLKALIAAAIGAVVVLGLIGVGAWRFASSQEIADFKAADPGGPVEARQAALNSFARALLDDGDAPSAVATVDYLVDIDPNTPRALNAIMLRADARAAMGDTEGARADLNELISRFGEDNFLHIQAKKKLEKLE
jgi:hypothetical protein